MPAICRITDSLSTGHICASTTTIASPNTDGTVHAEGLDVIVVGYRVFPFVFAWLSLGELSSPWLNLRWALIASGRGVRVAGRAIRKRRRRARIDKQT